MYSILLIDDHPESGEVTKSWIEQDQYIHVTLIRTILEAKENLTKYNFNLCIYHLNKMLPVDLECIHLIQDIPILFIGQVHTYTMMDKLLNLGVIAFIENDPSHDQLIWTIRNVLNGISVLPVTLLKQLHHREGVMDYVVLNNKERSILECVAEGKSNKELAVIFCVSQRTVEYYLTNIFNKFEVHSRLEAVVAAKNRGMINV
ncbi:hypothetical protein C5G87_25585 [Paenibacillus peoriae]|uniref:Response regulator transcription factor n=1 Tax=Paenibacillus polymyxa TaxID=1406 RepID=A0AAE9IDQ7_PAEPO|nr:MULTISPECIES: response regulator transcription factor [Paenibacillus]MCP3807280.1 response regulator transcription factor [Paenibacillus sp. Lou8.1]PPQ45982.1 hypothetical protein C5G87_25585 [Paenibacillus peoriae]URJ50417.1 response regulator transcription factor [Paenibacillus polymyxa]